MCIVVLKYRFCCGLGSMGPLSEMAICGAVLGVLWGISVRGEGSGLDRESR